MKIAKILWTLASFYLLIVGFFYIIILKEAPDEGLARFEFIQDNWGVYDYQWKAEFLIAAFLAISSFIFGSRLKNSGFHIIAVGQLIIAIAFPISIGITPNASYEIGALIGRGGHQLVNFGMLLSLGGFFFLHWNSNILHSWLRTTALIFSAAGFLSFGLGFINVIEPIDAQKGMIFVIFLYLINGYYGIKINETNSNTVYE